MDRGELEAKRLREYREDVERALRTTLDPSEVLPLLHRLVRRAPPASEESAFANQKLAELLVERHPWRASIHARKVLLRHGAVSPAGGEPGVRGAPGEPGLSQDGMDERAWAILGLCQTLLGHYRYATKAYRNALAAAPDNPWYAHNLGHLLDVALGDPKGAVPFLTIAHLRAPGHQEIVASLVHALARAGDIAQAKKLLAEAARGRGTRGSREHAALAKWVEAGAPPEKDSTSSEVDHRSDRKQAARPRRGRASESDGGPHGTAVGPAAAVAAVVREVRPPSSRKPRGKRALVATFEESLARGLSHLPLEPRHRAQARALGKDAAIRGLLAEGHPAEGLAAALAYAVIQHEAVPLTQAEVAATFRVSAANLRGRFSALRSVAPSLVCSRP